LLPKHPYDLSGGEQQKAAIGKMLLLKPKILLLDEPTKGIDASSKNRLLEIKRDLKKNGITILMVTHDVEFAAEASDRCGMFFDKEVTSIDLPKNFFCNNSFYTTAANRIARHMYRNV
ncbi:ATP-binding cassette domain-containing protein, partial [Enterobacter sichuanensis]